MQTREHLSISKISHPHQSGFTKGLSTTTLLIEVIQELSQAINNQLQTNVILIDFALIDLHWDYLTNTTQFVCFNKNNSSILTVESGVPQDAVLARYLFNLYINDVMQY